MKKNTKKLKEDFLKVFEASAGNITNSCKKIGIERKTYYNWINKDKIFKEKVEAIQDGLLDFAETMLMKKIKDGDNTSLIFFLKTKGKHRGYSERFEVENKTVEEFASEKAINIYLPKKED